MSRMWSPKKPKKTILNIYKNILKYIDMKGRQERVTEGLWY